MRFLLVSCHWVSSECTICEKYIFKTNKSTNLFLISCFFHSSDGIHWHLLLEAAFVAWRAGVVVQYSSQQKFKLGNILLLNQVYAPFMFSHYFDHWIAIDLHCSVLLDDPPVNLTLSVVLLFCSASCPGLHAAFRPLRPPWQADEAAAVTHRGFYPHLLDAATQRDALHHLHLPCAQLGGCPRLFFHVGWNIWRKSQLLITCRRCKQLMLTFFLLCALVCVITRNPASINWAPWSWLASCWPTLHTRVFVSMFHTTTTQGGEDCRNYTGCCQQQQVGSISSITYETNLKLTEVTKYLRFYRSFHHF